MRPLKIWLNTVIAAFFIIFCTVDFCIGADPTVSIDLIKTEDDILSATNNAETEGDGTNILKVDGFDVEIDKAVVVRGDYIFKLLRERGALDIYNLARLLAIIKKLNPSLKNLDLIYPGEVITLPLKIEPIGSQSSYIQKTIPQEIPFDLYTVKKGDTVSAIIREYNENLSFSEYKKYLEVFSRLNPEIENPDIIFQGQKIRLPIFPKTTVRKAIERPLAEKKPASKDSSALLMSLEEKVDAIHSIFAAMGEKWIDSGQHFIPFPSGGHINLDAVSFPILSVRTGKKIIFDINNKLTDDICKLIEGSWDQYKILKMMNWTFTTFFDELLKLCSYPAVRRGRQPFIVDANPEIFLEGDWIVTMGTSDDTKLRPKLAVISESSDEWNISYSLRRYLSEIGIVAIEIENLKKSDSFSDVIPPRGGSDTYIKNGSPQLIETLLDMNNITFIRDNVVSIDKGNSAGLNLTVSADFMINRGGKDYIIDISGLSEEMIFFLTDNKFRVLSVADYEEKPEEIARKIFSFFDIDYKSPPPPLRSGGDRGVKVTINMDGVLFVSASGVPSLVLSSDFSDSVMSFLHEKGFSLIIPEYQ